MDSNIEPGQKVKQSEKVFLANTHQAEVKARTASRIYHMVSKAVLSLGVGVAVALPLSMLSNSSDSSGSDPKIETHYNYATTPNDIQPARLEAVIKNIVGLEPHVHGPTENPTSGDQIEVAGPNILIKAVPPLNKEWHRAVFRNSGDALWALPGVDLVIRLNSRNDCDSQSCVASFDLESDKYLNSNVLNALQLGRELGRCNTNNSDRCLSFSDDLVAGDDRCQVLLDSVVPITVCHFTEAGEDQDLCLWARRSTAPESAGQVALDVKWNTMPVVTPGQQCRDRLNETVFRED